MLYVVNNNLLVRVTKETSSLSSIPTLSKCVSYDTNGIPIESSRTSNILPLDLSDQDYDTSDYDSPVEYPSTYSPYLFQDGDPCTCISIAYAPQNRLVDEVMETIIEDLGDDWVMNVDVVGFDSEEDMLNHAIKATANSGETGAQANSKYKYAYRQVYDEDYLGIEDNIRPIEFGLIFGFDNTFYAVGEEDEWGTATELAYPSTIGYKIYYNRTISDNGWWYDSGRDPIQQSVASEGKNATGLGIQVQNHVERALLKVFANVDMEYNLSAFPEVNDNTFTSDKDISVIGMIFTFCIMTIFSSVIIVVEKHNNKSLLCRMVGVSDISMWFSWSLFYFLLYELSVIFLVITGTYITPISPFRGTHVLFSLILMSSLAV
ncbi:hypothetical protein ADUPG1_005961, partial [Aduncisulcus paluster]